MKRRNIEKLSGWVAVGVLGVSSAAMAQTAPPTPEPTVNPGQGGADSSRSAAVYPPPPPLGLLVQQNHGSLMRAAIASQPDPSAPPASSYNFFSVPVPKPKVIKKHDLVTIVVREVSAFSSGGTTDLKHHADLDAQIDSYIQLHFSPLSLKAQAPSTPLELKAVGDRNFKGEATVDRSDSLTARITAEVLDVKPNGNLVLQATKKIKTDEEEQQFVLIGTCRAEDITPDNTVLSTQLYNLELNKTHKGAVRDTTERGFVPRLLDSINPF